MQSVTIAQNLWRSLKASHVLCFAALMLWSLAMAGTVHAQQIKPLNIEPDANGVDMLSGKISQEMRSVEIPAASKLRLERLMDLQPLLKGTIQATNGASPAQASFQVNNSSLTSDSLDCYESECRSTTGNGSSMFAAYQANRYIYAQGGTGLKIIFDSLYNKNTEDNVYLPPTYTSLYPSQIIYPSGETLSFTYDKIPFGTTIGAAVLHRPTKITSTLGYEMHISYQAVKTDYSNALWGYVDIATIYKSTDTNTPLAQNTYSGDTVTDLSGRTWSCCANALGGPSQISAYAMRLPGETVDSYKAEGGTITSGIFTSQVTDKVTKDGAAYNYAYTVDDQNPPNYNHGDVKIKKITITDPDLNNTTIDIQNFNSTIDPSSAYISRVKKVTNALGQATTYEYDTQHRTRIKKIIFPEGNSVEVTYDLVGNITNKITRDKSGGGDLEEKAGYPDDIDVFCLSVSCFLPDWTEDAKGNRTDYTWHNSGGLLTSLAPPDADGMRAKTINLYEQNIVGSEGIYRVIKQTLCAVPIGGGTGTCGTPAEHVKDTTYWEGTFLPLTETVSDGTTAITTSYTYDDAGRMLSVDGPLPGTSDKSYYRYDIVGRKTWEISPMVTPYGGGEAYRATRTTYRDADSQVIKVENGTLSSPTDTSLSVFQTAEHVYNDRRLKIKTLTRGDDGTIASVTQASYDNRNLPECSVVRMNEATFANPESNACALGTAGVEGNDRITKNIYDALGRVVQMRRAVGSANEQAEITYSYTANGQKKFVIDANGNRAQMDYDGHDRLAKWIFPSTNRPTAFNPSTPANALATAGSVNVGDYELYGYDENGNRTSLRKRDGSILGYTYDALNRVTLKTVPSRTGLAAIHSRDVHYKYDIRGLQLEARFDSLSGPGVSNAYDVLGRMTSSTNRMFASPQTLTYQYDIAGRRTRITHPDGEYFSYGYDVLGRETAVQEGSNALISTLYNDRGQKRFVTADQQGALASSDSLSIYRYHQDGRLKQLIQRFYGGATNVVNKFGFTYNPAGQIISRTTSNDQFANTAHYDVDRGYTTNGLNQYTQAGPAIFTYDANGNLTGDGWITFTYDIENRLVEASGSKSLTLTYDPLGRLWETDPGTGTDPVTRFLYDGDALVAEYDYQNNLQHRYVHGNGIDNPLLWYDGATVSEATRRHLYANWQGSIAGITDGKGELIHVNAYDAYGIPNQTNIGRFQYTGQIYLPELGIYHYKARAYSATLGRFLQTDPIGYEDQYNLYAYVGGDPVNAIDPTGTCEQVTGSRICRNEKTTLVKSETIPIRDENGKSNSSLAVQTTKNYTAEAIERTKESEFTREHGVTLSVDEKAQKYVISLFQGQKKSLLGGGSLNIVPTDRKLLYSVHTHTGVGVGDRDSPVTTIRNWTRGRSSVESGPSSTGETNDLTSAANWRRSNNPDARFGVIYQAVAPDGGLKWVYKGY